MEESSYSAQSLYNKITKEYSGKLCRHKVSNEKGIIIYNAKLSVETAVWRACFDKSCHRGWILLEIVDTTDSQHLWRWPGSNPTHMGVCDRATLIIQNIFPYSGLGRCTGLQCRYTLGTLDFDWIWLWLWHRCDSLVYSSLEHHLQRYWKPVILGFSCTAPALLPSCKMTVLTSFSGLL